MMPTCRYKKCGRVAEHELGEIIYPSSKPVGGRPWQQVEYLCLKHRNKILKLLNIPINVKGVE